MIVIGMLMFCPVWNDSILLDSLVVCETTQPLLPSFSILFLAHSSSLFFTGKTLR